MTRQPSPNGGNRNGRGPGGQFAKGNPGGPGNPHGQPSPPAPKQAAGWTAAARAAWLKGSATPSAADVFRRLCERIAFFVDLPREQAPGTTATLALWVVLSDCYPIWDAVPYLYVGGPAGSGKSRVFDILSRLVFRPFTSSNVTGPTVFRTLHNQGGVLLFDEAEQLKRTNEVKRCRFSFRATSAADRRRGWSRWAIRFG